MTELLADPQTPARRRSRPSTVVRVLAVCLLLVSWVQMLALAGQPASLMRLVSDLQQHRTSHVLVVGDHAVWRDGALRSRELRLHDLPALDDQSTIGNAEQLGDMLQRYDVPRQAVRRAPAALNPRLTLGIAGLLAFLLLLSGPDPWRFNRWGWFWLLMVCKGTGLGVMGFLLLSTSRPWRRVAPGTPRGGGWSGWLWSLLLGLFLSALALGLHQWLLPDLLDRGTSVTSTR